MSRTPLQALTAIIAGGIAARGTYLMFDDRLDLICGRGCSKNPQYPRNFQLVMAFAAFHKWSATFRDGLVVFRLAAA